MAAGIQSPDKELRFTRSGQAVIFWVAAAVLAGMALTLALTSMSRASNPQLPHPAWAVLPLLASLATLRLAMRLTRHAYLILTPIGIEIFPFFRPAEGMNMVAWQEIHSMEIDAGRNIVTLHYNAAKSAGIHLSLRPIRAERIDLLLRALAGRIHDAKP